MSEKELDVATSEINVRTHKRRVLEARIEMDEGYKQLKARMESRYENLKAAYDASLLDLEEAELYLKHAKAKLDRSFD